MKVCELACLILSIVVVQAVVRSESDSHKTPPGYGRNSLFQLV
jgi:hypothetical protein